MGPHLSSSGAPRCSALPAGSLGPRRLPRRPPGLEGGRTRRPCPSEALALQRSRGPGAPRVTTRTSGTDTSKWNPGLTLPQDLDLGPSDRLAAGIQDPAAKATVHGRPGQQQQGRKVFRPDLARASKEGTESDPDSYPRVSVCLGGLRRPQRSCCRACLRDALCLGVLVVRELQRELQAPALDVVPVLLPAKHRVPRCPVRHPVPVVELVARAHAGVVCRIGPSEEPGGVGK